MTHPSATSNNHIKVGLSTSSVYPKKMRAAFSYAKELGYDGVEVMVTNDTETQTFDSLKRLTDEYQIPVLSIHAPVLLLTHFVWGRDPELKLWKSAELCKQVGGDTVVVHPPFSWQKDYSKTFLTTVESISTLIGVNVAVENMFPWRARGREVKAYAPEWAESANKASSLTLDFSHSALAGWDALQVVKGLHGKVKHLHLCDGYTTHGLSRKVRKASQSTENPLGKDKVFDEHLLPGRGNQPVAETLQFLAGEGWGGTVVAEVNTRKSSPAQRREQLAETLTFAREHLRQN